jgi:hypothetical protein
MPMSGNELDCAVNCPPENEQVVGQVLAFNQSQLQKRQILQSLLQ